VKTTEAGGPRGYDAAKKVTGRKRHIAVDTQGLLLGVVVHAASIQDADGAGGLLGRIKLLYCWLRAVFADSAYNRVPAILACFLLGLVLLIVSRPRGAKGFVLLPRRWVAERTLGWLGRWRRLSRDYEHLPEVSEAVVTLAMIRLMTHRAVQPRMLFATRDPARSAKVMAALDAVNARYGRGTLRPLATGIARSWSTRHDRLSQRYTTRVEEVLTATAW